MLAATFRMDISSLTFRRRRSFLADPPHKHVPLQLCNRSQSKKLRNLFIGSAATFQKIGRVSCQQTSRWKIGKHITHSQVATTHHTTGLYTPYYGPHYGDECAPGCLWSSVGDGGGTHTHAHKCALVISILSFTQGVCDSACENSGEIFLFPHNGVHNTQVWRSIRPRFWPNIVFFPKQRIF